MEAVLIDQFVVPEGAVEEFLRHVHFSANIVKTRPGFVEGYVLQRASGDGRVNVVAQQLVGTIHLSADEHFTVD